MKAFLLTLLLAVVNSTLLTYDSSHVITLTDSNHLEFLETAQELNATMVLFIYSPKSNVEYEQFLGEFNQVATRFYKLGELTHDIFLAKIDADKDK